MDPPPNTAVDKDDALKKLLFRRYYECLNDIRTVLTKMAEYLESTPGQVVPGGTVRAFAKLQEDFKVIEDNAPRFREALNFLARERRLQDLDVFGRSVEALLRSSNSHCFVSLQDFASYTDGAIERLFVDVGSMEELQQAIRNTPGSSNNQDVSMGIVNFQDSRIRHVVIKRMRETYGGAGAIFKGVFFDETTNTMTMVSLKRQLRPNMPGERERIQQELDVWRTLDYEHILPLKGTCEINNTLHLLSPWIEGGDAMKFINAHANADGLFLLRQGAEGVKYLHDMGIIHGDLKGQNMLVTLTGHVYLTDFGNSRPVGTDTRTSQKGNGSFFWQAPETQIGRPKSLASDIYSFGITIAEIIQGHPPCDNDDLGKHLGPYYNNITLDVRPQRTPTVSAAGTSYEAAWDVADRCWKTKATERCDINYVLEHLPLRLSAFED